MARLARVIVPKYPHHITQRGNRNQIVFFNDDDRKEYLRLIAYHARLNQVLIWAYCLMDNHVHFIAVPETGEGLSRCFQEAHRLYTRRINFREGWRGFLWQGRFASYPMDEKYLIAGIRYVESNPVNAGLVDKAEDYIWSSAKAHISKSYDPLLNPCYLTDQIKDWSEYLRTEDKVNINNIEKCTKTGRPLGSIDFVNKIETMLGRTIKKQKPGPKPVPINN
ncbi:MAG: transposase [Chlamydiota bacterium]|nr:transposase [Chlamydiota bacterium]